MSWVSEPWLVEALMCVGVGFVLIKIICVVADFMDRE
jgi:hypothetical protein